ncbi:MAG: porin family protein [Mucinivorans sp.]
MKIKILIVLLLLVNPMLWAQSPTKGPTKAAVAKAPTQQKPRQVPSGVSETVAAAWAPVVINHHFGIRGGYGLSTARFEPKRNVVSLIGFYNFGLSYRFDVPKQKYVGCIEVDVEFLQKGYKYETFNESKIFNIRTYNTIMVPILWQPYLPLSKKNGSRFFLNVGPWGSYALSSQSYTLDDNTGIQSDKVPYSYDILKDNRWEFGITAGAGLIFGAGNFTFGIDFRYNIGLSDIYKGVTKYEGNPFRSPVDQMNISLGINYKIPSKTKKKRDDERTTK